MAQRGIANDFFCFFPAALVVFLFFFPPGGGNCVVVTMAVKGRVHCEKKECEAQTKHGVSECWGGGGVGRGPSISQVEMCFCH